jgi:hypothetical protein
LILEAAWLYSVPVTQCVKLHMPQYSLSHPHTRARAQT